MYVSVSSHAPVPIGVAPECGLSGHGRTFSPRMHLERFQLRWGVGGGWKALRWAQSGARRGATHSTEQSGSNAGSAVVDSRRERSEDLFATAGLCALRDAISSAAAASNAVPIVTVRHIAKPKRCRAAHQKLRPEKNL